MKLVKYPFAMFLALTCSLDFLFAGTAFRNHGPVAPVARERRSFTTAGADGEPVLILEIEGRVLFLEPRTGEAEYLPGRAGISYFSADNRIYATGNGQLIEIDPAGRTMRYLGEMPPRRPRNVTECEDGLIYFAMFPDAELLIYDPGTGELKNHGRLDTAGEGRRLYPYVVVDGTGWVYFSMQMGRVNLIAYNPATGERRQLLPEGLRVERPGYMSQWRAADGRCYAWVPTRDGGRQWYRLYEGEAEKVNRPRPRPETARPGFPEGVELVELNTPGRYLVIREEGREPRRVEFDYEAAGRPPYGAAAGPDGKIYGSTGNPLRIFRFCQETESMDSWGLAGARGRPHAGHVDVMKTMGDKIYGIVYSCGSLIAYDPSKPFEEGELGEIENPKLLYGGGEDTRYLIGRPFSIEAHPDRRHIIGGGQAARLHARGGMVIYDTEKGEGKLYDVLEEQGVNAITVLEDGNLVLGGSLRPPTGGSPPVRREAEIGIFDFAKREMTFTKVPVPGSNRVHGLVAGGDGLVYGIAMEEEFFVFDPDSKEVIHREGLNEHYGPLTSRDGLLPFYGGRWDRHDVMDFGPGGMLYILFRDCLVGIDTSTLEHRRVANLPESAWVGFAISGGRLYYAAGPDLWSFDMDFADGE